MLKVPSLLVRLLAKLWVPLLVALVLIHKFMAAVRGWPVRALSTRPFTSTCAKGLLLQVLNKKAIKTSCGNLTIFMHRKVRRKTFLSPPDSCKMC
jgi:hypothetical protein